MPPGTWETRCLRNMDTFIVASPLRKCFSCPQQLLIAYKSSGKGEASQFQTLPMETASSFHQTKTYNKQKENYRLIFLINVNAKFLTKILANQTQEYIKMVITLEWSWFHSRNSEIAQHKQMERCITSHKWPQVQKSPDHVIDEREAYFIVSLSCQLCKPESPGNRAIPWGVADMRLDYETCPLLIMDVKHPAHSGLCHS